MTSLHQKIKDTQKSVRILSRGCENAKIKASILTTLLGELSTKTTGTGVMISDTLIQQTIKKFIKNNEETMGCTFDQGILHRLTVENNCLNEFLPKQLTESELRLSYCVLQMRCVQWGALWLSLKVNMVDNMMVNLLHRLLRRRCEYY